MNAKKRLIGLNGIYLQEEHRKNPPTLIPGLGVQLNFMIIGGTFTRQKQVENRMITSRPVSQKIQELKKNIPLTKIPLGSFSVMVDHEMGVIRTTGFFPSESIKLLLGKSVLEKTGYGHLAELALERHLLKKFPHYKIQSSPLPKNVRKVMLEKKGRKVGEPIPIWEAKERTRKYVIAMHKKSRGLPHTPLK